MRISFQKFRRQVIAMPNCVVQFIVTLAAILAAQVITEWRRKKEPDK